MLSRIINILINFKRAKYLTRKIARLFGVDIPTTVLIGENLQLPHGGQGVVIHPHTTIGNNVKIYQQVTLGRSDIWNEQPHKDFKGITLCDDVIICSGARVLTKEHLIIGRGTIVGANAVLTISTGEDEVWAGIPARCIRRLPPKKRQTTA
jgi:serine O-acetyltransferase